MELKKGYKQTDIGVIPTEWEVEKLESVTPKNAKFGIVDGPFGSNLKTIHYRKSGIPIITSGYVTEGRFEATEYLYVDQEKRSTVRPGDIVMAKIGARCGASAILPESHEIGILSGNALKITVDTTRHSTYYIWQVLWDLYSNGNIEALRTVGAQPAISMPNLKNFQIPLPPLPEQRAIASALSDVDALLTALDSLIVKKVFVKQGTMQELLTGKRRLPGFSAEWETKKLGEITEIVSGGTPSTQIAEYWNGNINWCTPTDITRTPDKYLNSTEKRITELGLKSSSATLLPKGTLLLCSRATIGEVKIATDAICTNQGFKSLICSNQVYNEFLYYVLLTIKPKLIEKAIGSTFLEITKKETSLIEIELPSISEQQAIAEILSDMDAEITALETRREKTSLLKQGMMQELLGGKIRLNHD